MSWRESSRETHRDREYVTYRCSWCRKMAVVCIVYGDVPPSRCCCADRKR